MDDLFFGLKIVVSGVLFFVFLVWVAIAISYQVASVPVQVYMNGKRVYTGPQACVSIQSAGSATETTIYGGWYCLFPKAYYVSNNILVEGEKE